MTSVTFDRFAYIDKLKSGGVSDEQARVQADALDIALLDTVATKADISEVKIVIAEMKYDMIKWLVPLLLGQAALVAALVKLL
jgi:hypothetical protein